jgi:hypothetical protein
MKISSEQVVNCGTRPREFGDATICLKQKGEEISDRAQARHDGIFPQNFLAGQLHS